MTKMEELKAMLERVDSTEGMEKVQAKVEEVNAEIQERRDVINDLLTRIDNVNHLEAIEGLVREFTKL